MVQPLLDWVLKRVSTTFHGGYFAANKQFLTQLPIRTINYSDKADVKRHDRMVAMVQSMLNLNKRVGEMKPGHEHTVLERDIAATDRRIDELVYELYGLTDKEVKIVEEATTQR